MTIFAVLFLCFFSLIFFYICYVLSYLLITWTVANKPKLSCSLIFRILWRATLSFKFSASMLVLLLFNKFKNAWFTKFDSKYPSAKKIGKFYLLEYMIENQKYSLITRLPEMPSLAIVSDGEGNDLTLEFISYCGPENNFHGSNLTPNDLGFERLTVLFEGIEKTFERDEILRLDKKLKSSDDH
jgi:hypothetical protein